MALSAKEKLLALIKSSGWTPDESWKIAPSRWSEEKVTNPNAFLHAGPDGGQWRIHLNWQRKGSSWNSTPNGTLHSVGVEFIPADAEVSDQGRLIGRSISTLRNFDKGRRWGSHGALWDALKGEMKPNGTVRSLRETAELLIKDPDTAIWLGFQAEHDAKVKTERREAALQADREARARKLPVTVPQDGMSYDSRNQWAKLARTLDGAAGRIVKADGKSDLPKLVADAQKALNAIINVLTDEASLEFADHMVEEVPSTL